MKSSENTHMQINNCNMTRELDFIKLPRIKHYTSTVKEATNTAWEVRDVLRRKLTSEYN